MSPTLPRSTYAATQLAATAPRVPFGLPNLRRNVCPHFYMTGPRGPIAIQAPHMVKAYMDAGYVSDICLSPRFNQCVFYEDQLTGR